MFATVNGLLTSRMLMLRSGRSYRKPLKLPALAAIDSVNNRMNKSRALLFANMLNADFLQGNLRMQALSAPFRIYSEGAVSPLAEADPLLRRLIATELEDVAKRCEILSEPEFVEAFREMWMRGKSGFNLAHLRRILRIENEFLTRDLNDMVIYRSVVTPWLDKSMAWIYQRYVAWLGMAEIIEDAEELRAFHAMGDFSDEIVETRSTALENRLLSTVKILSLPSGMTRV